MILQKAPLGMSWAFSMLIRIPLGNYVPKFSFVTFSSHFYPNAPGLETRVGDVRAKRANNVGKTGNLKRRGKSARIPPTLIASGLNNRQNEIGDEKKSKSDVSNNLDIGIITI